MQMVIVGANYKTMPINLREKLAIPKTKLVEILKELNEEIKERVILSTCNRIEVYATTNDVKKTIVKIINFLHKYYPLNKEEFESYLYIHQDEEVVKHLFKVVTSLDSMVIGEPQILSQVKESYEQAVNANTTGPYLNTLFQKAISVGKRVRNETEIGKGRVSVSFAAVELAKKICGGNLEGKKVLIIGSGEMAKESVKSLSFNKVNTIFLATNRNYERALEIASKFSAKAIKLDEIYNILPEIDIVISATFAPHFIIRKEEIKNILHLRKYQPLFFIDIAIPRNIDPEIGSLDGICVYNIDDLQTVIQSHIKQRQKEIKKCQLIIDNEVKEFCHWLNFRQLSPIISSLKEKMELIRQEELKKVFSKEKNITQKEKETIELVTSRLIDRLLKEPILTLKKYASTKDPTYGRILSELFNLKS